MATKWSAVTLTATAGFFVALSAGGAQACFANSFITTGCFTTITIVDPVGGGDPGFQWIKSTGNSNASLTLSGSSAPITSVTFDFKAQPPEKAFAISLAGFFLSGGATSFLVNDDVLHTLTFFSAISGGMNDLAFVFSGANPNSVEIGNLVATSQAPAPVPGAGFLSFILLGLGRLRRGAKELAARVVGRPTASAA